MKEREVVGEMGKRNIEFLVLLFDFPVMSKRLRPSISVQQETGSIEIVFWTPVSSPFVYG